MSDSRRKAWLALEKRAVNQKRTGRTPGWSKRPAQQVESEEREASGGDDDADGGDADGGDADGGDDNGGGSRPKRARKFRIDPRLLEELGAKDAAATQPGSQAQREAATQLGSKAQREAAAKRDALISRHAMITAAQTDTTDDVEAAVQFEPGLGVPRLNTARRGLGRSKLPPGWLQVECVSSTGKHYRRYVGPTGGKKIESVAKAWTLHNQAEHGSSAVASTVTSFVSVAATAIATYGGASLRAPGAEGGAATAVVVGAVAGVAAGAVRVASAAAAAASASAIAGASAAGVGDGGGGAVSSEESSSDEFEAYETCEDETPRQAARPLPTVTHRYETPRQAARPFIAAPCRC